MEFKNKMFVGMHLDEQRKLRLLDTIYKFNGISHNKLTHHQS